jgi:GNAT superfamily N-acetyltransferase
MPDFQIRAATSADIPTLIRHRRLMWLDMGREESGLKWLNDTAREYFTSAIPDGSYRGFVAVNGNGEIVGGGGIVISAWPGSLNQRSPKRAMILNMYVEQNYRRRGIARAMMQTMIVWCREHEFAYVGLHASDEGRPLYESLGFKPTNEMRLDLD